MISRQYKSFLIFLLVNSATVMASDHQPTGEPALSCHILRYGTDIYEEFTKMELSPLIKDRRNITVEYYNTVEQKTECKQIGDSLSCTWNKWLGLGFYRYNLRVNTGEKYVYEGPHENLFQYSLKGELEAWFIRPVDILCDAWHPDAKD